MTKKELLIATIFTFVIILAWVIFDIVHERQKVEIPANLQQDIEPIDPNFDTDALNTP